MESARVYDSLSSRFECLGFELRDCFKSCETNSEMVIFFSTAIVFTRRHRSGDTFKCLSTIAIVFVSIILINYVIMGGDKCFEDAVIHVSTLCYPVYIVIRCSTKHTGIMPGK